MISKGQKIAPAQGKLGVVIPGMGAVTSTFIAGVEAIKKGLAKPIGSLTQMGTIRLGKRTDNRIPQIKDFISLTNLDDLVFGDGISLPMIFTRRPPKQVCLKRA